MHQTSLDWHPDDAHVYGGHAIALLLQTKNDKEGGWTAERVQVLSRQNPKHYTYLPLPPVYRDNPIPFNRFIVSPDDRVIVADRKIGSGINAAYVFVRIGGLHYRLADKISLNERLWRQYGHPRDQKSGRDEQSPEFVLFQGYEKGSRYAVLACGYGERDPSQIWYFVTLDTHTGRLFDHHRVRYEDVSIRYVG